MVAIQIRSVPDDVRDALAQQATSRGQSLQGFLLGVLSDQAHRPQHRAVLARFAGRDDGSRTEPGESRADVLAERPDPTTA